jgi:outer membrane protein assembly factor BamE (lipoprotein component of BamABCDE complex)
MRGIRNLKSFTAAAILGAAFVAGCAGGPFFAHGPQRSDDVFSQIKPGATEADVQRLVGPPDETMAFPGTHTHAWSYRYTDTWGFAADFSVTFDADGRTVSTFSKRIGYGGDHGK